MGEPEPWPTEIRLSRDKRQLTVEFDDGGKHTFDAEFLRVLSPSAEVQGHSADQRQTVAGKREVGIVAVEPIGNYAVRLTFDDGHNTGLFTWRYFRSLSENRDSLWANYLSELAAKALSRNA